MEITNDEARVAEAVFCRDSFSFFVQCAWHVIEKRTPLAWGRHLDAICEHLEALARGELKNLIINMPPRHGKSSVVSVLWPAWMWIRDPRWRHLHASYDAKLALRDAQKTRELLSSSWFVSTFQPKWHFTGDQNTKGFWKNDQGGYRLATSIGAKSSTGWGGDNNTVDDPMKADSNPSRLELQNVIDWYTEQFYNRVEDPKNSTRMVVGQRLHEMDLSGYLLKYHRHEWEHLNLMSEFEPHRKSSTSIGWTDWREEAGELLFPERFDEEILTSEKSLGEFRWHSQHQQNPIPATGNLFKNSHIGFWTTEPREPVTFTDAEGNTCFYRQRTKPDDDDFELWAQSWDMAFKGTTESDRVCGQTWARLMAEFFLLDQVCENMWFDETLQAVMEMRRNWPKVTGVYIEDKANGSAALSMLENHIPGLVGVDPKGGKQARAQAVLPLMPKVWLPHPQEKTWTPALVSELLRFPKAEHDDQVDALTQGLTQMSQVPTPEPFSLTFL